MELAIQDYSTQPALFFSSKSSFPSSLVFQMKIGDLLISKCCVDYQLPVREVTKLFDQHPDWPGVILTNQDQFVGMLSRQRCFEAIGRPYGIEIFSRKSIFELFNAYGSPCLLMDATTSIQEGVKIALNRDRALIYEPVVIHSNNANFALLTMHTLLLAQSDLLEILYSEVHQLSVIDPLTNLKNRRGFFEAAYQEFSVIQENHSNLSALMIDIDNFKNTNDMYGHFVGDQVIQAVADECQKSLRQTDLIGRFGGEEFIVLLPNTSLETASSIAERLRQSIENMVVYTNGYQVSVSISIGVSHIKDAHGSLDKLLTQADQAMYGAKDAGRNRVKTWDQLTHQTQNGWAEILLLPTSGDGQSTKLQNHAARIYDETIEGWAKALEMRDKETEDHSKRVIQMTIALARKNGINEKEMVDIRRGALLHDIGKIAIPDSILFKPGKLTEEEWAIMRKHPTYAYELLSPIKFLNNCIDIPYCHHEHWDGSGYPRGLKGEEIPLAARIFTIVDVWDALSSDRCYRPAWKPDEARSYIIEQSGKLFDPAITPIFLEMLDSYGQLLLSIDEYCLSQKE